MGSQRQDCWLACQIGSAVFSSALPKNGIAVDRTRRKAVACLDVLLLSLWSITFRWPNESEFPQWLKEVNNATPCVSPDERPVV